MTEEYQKRINAVFEFIDTNLDNELSLEIVAQIACYSPFHFHRIFKMITNETLNQYIIRKKIEKAASLLLHKKELTITSIVHQLGFTSNAVFTRTFKNYYHQSPSNFKKTHLHKFSKISQIDSKNSQQMESYETYICNLMNLKNFTTMHAKIEIKELATQPYAYVTHIGVEGLEKAFQKIIQWCTPKQILENNRSKIIRVFHDSFKITNPDKVRMSIGVTLTETIAVNGDINIGHLQKGKYIVGRYELLIEDLEKAWTGLFIWMNENGYKKADYNPFEVYHNDFNKHPEKKAILDLYIPVEYYFN
ncbi:helix-turn-helix domain-containing protein [Flavobacterium sp. TP390]|uniref:Helix-turn-helix domain-containing protein n=1 Tax=Flavobacterium profundi TaxID=1774945 RepID=A0A6I4IFT1_9FLAO|nr:GyrI-like domain-containing protein [Flavobacterium profundi]MVO08525.1 helix-turn-helix domain-containing protein [Flavobacterium profundi]